MPRVSKADGNVPFIGPRARYSVVTTNPTWVLHKMAPGASLNGAAPKTATLQPKDVDPTVKAGMAQWDDLTEGGLFTLLAHEGQPIEVIDKMLPSGATAVIVGLDGTKLRDLPATYPFRLGACEVLKISGGAAGSTGGFLIKTTDKIIW